MIKKYFTVSCLFLTIPLIGFSQAQIVINGSSAVTIVENGGSSATPIYIEVNNPATSAISTSGSLGWIISEGEFNMVKWDIGTGTGTYVVPFGYSTTDYLPVSLNVVTAGAPATGTIKFATFHTNNDNIPWPSDVTNMGPAVLPGSPTNTDNAYNAVDRFWVVDANTGYTTTKPSPIIKFSYIDGGAGPTEVGGLNTATMDGTMIAQRFNTALGTWGDYYGSGVNAAGPPIGTVTNAAAALAPADFYRSWTLSAQSHPLPIQLTAFNVTCNNGAAVITWTTQSEVNNQDFKIEKSADGSDYETIATVPGAGNSTTALSYTVTDPTPMPGTSYYRLSQTDFDGNVTDFSPVAFEGCQVEGLTISAFKTSEGNIVVRINSSMADNYNVSLVSMLGQELHKEVRGVSSGYNEFMLNPGNLTYGIYIINVNCDRASYSKKLILGAL